MDIKKIDETIKGIQAVLAGLLEIRAREMERINSGPLIGKTHRTLTCNGTGFNCMEIHLNRPATLAEMISAAGISIPVPKTASYTIGQGESGIEMRITDYLTANGHILSQGRVRSLIESECPGDLSSVITDDGVFHRVGTIFISDSQLIEAYKGGPRRSAPSVLTTSGQLSPTLYLSPWGPGTKVFIHGTF